MADEWIVTASEAHQRLGLFLRDKFHGRYSAKLLKRWIEANRCEVNGTVERFASRQVLKGDRIALNVPSEPKPPPKQRALDLSRVLHQDDALILYDKAAGLTSESLPVLLEPLLGPLQLVHRLDKDTSGVMIFSRHEKAKKAIENLFRHRKVIKSYLAIVDGVPNRDEGVITNHLGKLHAYEGQTIWGVVPEAQGQYAETAWRCLSRGTQAALILCRPKTGRTHQLRVHLKELGHAILGDYQYERHPKCPYKPLRPMLHAWQIALDHPSGTGQLAITAPIPADFSEALKALQLTQET